MIRRIRCDWWKFGRIALPAITVTVLLGCGGEVPETVNDLLVVGGMHEAIGQKQHQGRISLNDILAKPHFYGVGALEGLQGEITIADSAAMVTTVGQDGQCQSLPPAGAQATMLVGQSVEAWESTVIPETVAHDRFDNVIRSAASRARLDGSKPFVFLVEGEFVNVRLHVIHGACPIHARMKKIALDPAQQPFELDAERVKGTLVGVYAEDAVGRLTHPATSVHAHLVYTDSKTGERVTGHLEQVGLAAGATLRLPKP